MPDELNNQMRTAAAYGRTADMNGLLDRGAEVDSTDGWVSRPSAAAGRGAPPPPQAPEAPSAPLAPAAAAATAPSPHRWR